MSRRFHDEITRETTIVLDTYTQIDGKILFDALLGYEDIGVFTKIVVSSDYIARKERDL
jgi:hypothetical protein